MKRHVPLTTSHHRLGFLAAVIGFAILTLVADQLEAGVVFANIAAAALGGAMIGAYARQPRPATRRPSRAPQLVVLPHPARATVFAPYAHARAA